MVPKNERMIDLRSDVRSRPTKEMLETVFEATLEDDVFGEDPTVQKLENIVATLLEKEAALFVPSGTMGNLICVMNHCWGRGSEVILGDKCHIHIYEQGGIAQLGGVHPRSVKNLEDGTFAIEEIERLLRANEQHFPITSLVCIENTHNLMGGKVLPLKWVDEVGKKCKELGIPLHVDGARLINAAVVLNVPPARLVRDASSVNICLSKGLGAPVGSVIAGTKEFIERAIRIRKVLGGGWRQSGVLAAMGIFAINHSTATLSNDHKHLTMIAKGIADLNSKFIKADISGQLSNILLIEISDSVMTSADFCDRMSKTTGQEIESLNEKIICKILPMSKTQVRLVTNNSITEEDVLLVLKKINYIDKEYK